MTFKDRLYDLWLSPVNGLYGIREVRSRSRSATPRTAGRRRTTTCEGLPAELVTAPRRTIGPYNEGYLFGAVQVFFFVLAIGAFITVTIKTGALDAGIARLTHRYRDPRRTC